MVVAVVTVSSIVLAVVTVTPIAVAVVTVTPIVVAVVTVTPMVVAVVTELHSGRSGNSELHSGRSGNSDLHSGRCGNSDPHSGCCGNSDLHSGRSGNSDLHSGRSVSSIVTSIVAALVTVTPIVAAVVTVTRIVVAVVTVTPIVVAVVTVSSIVAALVTVSSIVAAQVTVTPIVATVVTVTSIVAALVVDSDFTPLDIFNPFLLQGVSLCPGWLNMENYRQDFGFYYSEEPISLTAGKILSALQPGHRGGVLYQGNSEVCSSDTFPTGYHDESSNTELHMKLQVISPSLSPRILSRRVNDPDQSRPFMNIHSHIEQEDGESERQKKLLAVATNAECLLLPSLKLKRCSSEEPERSFTESKAKRKCTDISDGIKLWNIWSINEEEQCRLLDETRQAQTIVLTMLFQNGSSQLCSSKDESTLLNGILVLIIKKSDIKKSDLVSTDAEIYPPDYTYIHMTVTDNGLWDKDQVQHNFLRSALLHILQSRASVICFNAKDFLRTIYGKFMNFRHVAPNVILDPRIAAWLLNPADSSSSFEDLVSKHCLTLDEGATGSAPDARLQNTCKKLVVLYRLMVSLECRLRAEGLWDLFYNIELPLINILAAMENCSIEINQEELKRMSALLEIHLKGLEKEAHHAAGQMFRLTSSNELRHILYEKFHLHLKCKSKLPQTNLGHHLSTAEPALNQLKDLHPLPGIVLQFRQIQKIKSTFVDGLLTYVNKGCVSPTWNQTGTVSGRLSAKHPNIQGVSKLSVRFEKQQRVQGKSKETITINPRSMFVSAEGHSFLAADFSQIELRLLTHFSADPALLKLFIETERTDVFTEVASQWKDVAYENITQADREQTKRVVYSVIYGIGKERLAECLGTTPAEANAFMDCFLQKYRVSDFTQKVIQDCHSKGFVTSLMGRKRPLPHINSKNYGLKAQAERQAVNFVIQGSAADLCKLAMIKISASVTSSLHLTASLIAQIHDELLFEVQDSQLQEFAELVKHTMESLQHADGVQLKVPLKVTVTSGKSWGCMTELPAE
ncbi:DNA polymerase nu [Eleutherodactylus coqui]|uniref:DNA polymerase nu n=1 Tax=Eleutherodactylus coqui TaxID=57060 RepID=UPI003462193A